MKTKVFLLTYFQDYTITHVCTILIEQNIRFLQTSLFYNNLCLCTHKLFLELKIFSLHTLQIKQYFQFLLPQTFMNAKDFSHTYFEDYIKTPVCNPTNVFKSERFYTYIIDYTTTLVCTPTNFKQLKLKSSILSYFSHKHNGEQQYFHYNLKLKINSSCSVTNKIPLSQMQSCESHI